jgi:hypothetical protein
MPAPTPVSFLTQLPLLMFIVDPGKSLAEMGTFQDTCDNSFEFLTITLLRRGKEVLLVKSVSMFQDTSRYLLLRSFDDK